ncbi:MAG: hypothetical protein WA063_04350 [Minisyncoccia bacterium]
MRYSIIDVEEEIFELKSRIGVCGSAYADVLVWRMSQIRSEISIGSKLRNVRILSAIHRIKMAIESISDSKNKKSL